METDGHNLSYIGANGYWSYIQKAQDLKLDGVVGTSYVKAPDYGNGHRVGFTKNTYDEMACWTYSAAQVYMKFILQLPFGVRVIDDGKRHTVKVKYTFRILGSSSVWQQIGCGLSFSQWPITSDHVYINRWTLAAYGQYYGPSGGSSRYVASIGYLASTLDSVGLWNANTYDLIYGGAGVLKWATTGGGTYVGDVNGLKCVILNISYQIKDWGTWKQMLIHVQASTPGNSDIESASFASYTINTGDTTDGIFLPFISFKNSTAGYWANNICIKNVEVLG